jgi:FAD:protein FMN transferase
VIDRTEAILGTHIRIAVNSQDPQAASAVEAAFGEVRRIERTYSRFLDDNELSHLNASIGHWTNVSDELAMLLRYGKKLELETDGAFSLGVKPVLESWGYNARYELGREFGEAPLGGYELAEDGRVRLSGEIELGGLGKGYALDRMSSVLSDYADIFINAGGDVYGRGKDIDGRTWVCYLEHPHNPDRAIGEIELDDVFLASSSPLRRRWRDRHHLIDARRRLPANDMAAVSILGRTGLEADGYSTALFVSGYESAKKIAERHGFGVVLTSSEGDIFRSAAFGGKIYGIDVD